MKESKTVLVTGIVMIVFASMGIFWGFWNLMFAEFFVDILNFFQYEQDLGLMAIGLSVVLVNGILQLVTGILGINMYRKAQKKTGLIILSVFFIVLFMADFILSMSNWSLLGIVLIRTLLGLILPIIMIVGAVSSNIELSRHKRG